MDKQALLALLESLNRDDPEMAHLDADEALLSFLAHEGYADVVDAFNDARNRVGFWYS